MHCKICIYILPPRLHNLLCFMGMGKAKYLFRHGLLSDWWTFLYSVMVANVAFQILLLNNYFKNKLNACKQIGSTKAYTIY